MTTRTARLVLVLLPLVMGPAREPGPGPLVFTGVTVVSMTDSVPRPGQTVVVKDGRIAAVGPVGLVQIPAGAVTVSTPPGAFLIPGLADMHVHIFDRAELLLYLANGVTTIRNLHGLERHLSWRDSLDQDHWLGPRLLTSGPILDGSPPSRPTNVVLISAEQAEREVNREADLGFDYLKIYDNLPPDLYATVGRTAAARGLSMIGHLPTPVGLDGLFRMRLQAEVQHLEEFLPFFADGSDPRLLDSLCRTLARLDIAVVPTVSVFTSALDQSTDPARLEALPERRFVNPATMAQWGWAEVSRTRSRSPEERDRATRVVRFFLRDLLPCLQEAGVTIVAGTDAPIPTIIPGFAIHDELEFYVRAGLTPYQAIRTATVNAGRMLPSKRGDLSGFGTITIGAPADLLLLAGNPLTDIGNLRRPLGVVARGRWVSRAELDRGLDSLARGYAGS
jgi:Amidohydrolase family